MAFLCRLGLHGWEGPVQGVYKFDGVGYPIRDTRKCRRCGPLVRAGYMSVRPGHEDYWVSRWEAA